MTKFENGPSSIRALRTLVCAMLLAAACTPACTTEATGFTTDGKGPVARDPAGARIVTSITTEDSARLVFIDESDGEDPPSIGVEITSSRATPSTDALLAQAPSALELFLAAAPGEPAPRALVRDHELASAAAGKPGEPPRRLVAASLDGESSGFYDCADSTSWKNAFQAWAPVLDGEYIATNESGLTSGYVGYAPTFYFDVCRPNDVAGTIPYFTGVQRRTNSGAAWATISSMTGALNVQQRRWRYYHSTLTCSSFQYRLLVSSGSNLYHRAARWADEWSCQITSGG